MGASRARFKNKSCLPNELRVGPTWCTRWWATRAAPIPQRSQKGSLSESLSTAKHCSGSIRCFRIRCLPPRLHHSFPRHQTARHDLEAPSLPGQTHTGVEILFTFQRFFSLSLSLYLSLFYCLLLAIASTPSQPLDWPHLLSLLSASCGKTFGQGFTSCAFRCRNFVPTAGASSRWGYALGGWGAGLSCGDHYRGEGENKNTRGVVRVGFDSTSSGTAGQVLGVEFRYIKLSNPVPTIASRVFSSHTHSHCPSRCNFTLLDPRSLVTLPPPSPACLLHRWV